MWDCDGNSDSISLALLISSRLRGQGRGQGRDIRCLESHAHDLAHMSMIICPNGHVHGVRIIRCKKLGITETNG